MKMSKVDDILQNLMSKETIFSEVSSWKIKAHYASEAKKVVEKVSQLTSKTVYWITLKCTLTSKASIS